jgi:enamine deaminase RidA (YjgF/YER057c/UK114 family)
MSDAARLICSPELTDVAEYAYAALVTGGSSLVYAAWACPLNKDGATVGVGDVPAQAAQAMRNLRVSLHDAGASFDDIVRTTVYVASSDQRHLASGARHARPAQPTQHIAGSGRTRLPPPAGRGRRDRSAPRVTYHGRTACQ